MAIEQTDDQRPSGYTTDGVPWEEPRGPHLPDVLTRQPVLIWPFLVLAALVAIQDIGRGAGVPGQPSDVVIRTIGSVPSIAIVLLGAAWFWRRRDRSLRSPMGLGLALVALVEGLRFTSTWVVDFAVSRFSGVDDPFAALRFGTMYSILEGVVSIAGFLLLMTAFQMARRRPAAPRERIATLGIAAIAIATLILEVWNTWNAVQAAGGIPDDVLVAVNLPATLLGVVSIVVTAAVTVVLVAGAMAGETPAPAWRLGAIGLATLLVSRAVVMGVTAIGSSFPQAWFSPLQWALVIVEAIGALALLAGVILGLPSPGSSEDTPAPATDAPMPDAPRSITDAAS